MTIPAFDTLAFVKKLIASGMPQKQAEAQAEVQAQILSELVTEKLATKEDITDLKSKIKEDMTDLNSLVKEDVEDLKNRVGLIDSKLERIVIDFNGKFRLLNWMFGFLLGGTAGILFKLYSG